MLLADYEPGVLTGLAVIFLGLLIFVACLLAAGFFALAGAKQKFRVWTRNALLMLLMTIAGVALIALLVQQFGFHLL